MDGISVTQNVGKYTSPMDPMVIGTEGYLLWFVHNPSNPSDLHFDWILKLQELRGILSCAVLRWQNISGLKKNYKRWALDQLSFCQFYYLSRYFFGTKNWPPNFSCLEEYQVKSWLAKKLSLPPSCPFRVFPRKAKCDSSSPLDWNRTANKSRPNRGGIWKKIKRWLYNYRIPKGGGGSKGRGFPNIP